jgi:hypothetical protein
MEEDRETPITVIFLAVRGVFSVFVGGITAH